MRKSPIMSRALVRRETRAGYLFLLPSLFFFLTFVFAFAMGGSMFYIVWKKNKEKPMEKTYTEVDYTYNGITGEVRDNSREITEEEFRSGSRH